jgi:hypothetical protein
MKNSKPFSAKVRSCLAASAILFMFVLLFASCQKDNTIQPASTTSSSYSSDRAPSPSSGRGYEMIKIDHQPMRGPVPDYVVTVYANGTGLFYGRKNVVVLGETAFSIDAATFQTLQRMYATSNFFNVDVKVPSVPDAPLTFTTYNNGNQNATLVDYDAGIPGFLIKLREQTENLLHISRYINGTPG